MNKLSANKTILITGAVMALLAVLLGAFGAHGLEKLVDPESINSFTTGVRYQMYHAIVCIILGNMSVLQEVTRKRIFYFFMGGITLFSGSIYLLVIDEVLGISLSSIGFITPLGGLLLILGWVFFVISLVKIK
ncbi:uncharacterized membrane protein YgdD (TMEM256/DUF423 family) [Aquimarina sp. EL_43]|uniref:DUF423 domain-containing protein n=1 Tax=Aquimarina TaxID=290174 RepID=UPI000470DB3D|nr:MULTISPECIES: DUF423 domain-containing protein [Aquimarina]MBG6131916.1 uncharacterized membrane protein YgdD (TMEM256/DUF423 family) [Aquimarina sp. EL_35]MBG6149480.1 uncharacterized membrane protein YgdD (TMEM256/DUF423 family) [Aquimarina sp. EL_32]MBG6170257.1 uncharacterized membrane protein YgdD (TMEM256/DUF423 family) [Aquimarina sp. EL_43]